MFNKLLKKNDDAHEFKPLLAEIEDDPVNPLGRTIFWIIIAIIVFTIFWLTLGKVDIVVSARGQIIPDGNIKILQPFETGVISSILIKEGDFVKKGQVLMEIDPSTTAPQLKSLKQNLNYIELESLRLDATSQGVNFIPPTLPNIDDLENNTAVSTQQEIYSTSLTGLNKQLESKKLELQKVDEQIKSALTQKNNYQSLLNLALDKEKRLLSVVDIIAKNDLEKIQADINTHQTNVKALEYKLQELTHQKNQVVEETGYITSNFKTTNLKELSDRQKQTNQLKSDISQITFKNTKQNIIAPVDGYVNSLLVHTVGGVVTPAEKLISIIPVNTPLLIKSTALNKDIGYIKEGMPVSIKIDTFDFQKYGILKGKVKNVSKDSIQDEKLGPIYEIYITPLEKSLIVDRKKVFIASGMSLTSEIKVGKRRIIEFFIYPLIKYLDEGMSVR